MSSSPVSPRFAVLETGQHLFSNNYRETPPAEKRFDFENLNRKSPRIKIVPSNKSIRRLLPINLSNKIAPRERFVLEFRGHIFETLAIFCPCFITQNISRMWLLSRASRVVKTVHASALRFFSFSAGNFLSTWLRGAIKKQRSNDYRNRRRASEQGNENIFKRLRSNVCDN